jgi:hypothetical protein
VIVVPDETLLIDATLINSKDIIIEAEEVEQGASFK